MKRPASSFRNLLPLTTDAPVQDQAYEQRLSALNPYRPLQNFAKRLDKYDRDPTWEPPWGGELPARFLLDHDDSEVPRAALRRDPRTKKLVPSQAAGFANYAAAIWLYDTIVRVTEPNTQRGDVLPHAKVAEVSGDVPVLAELKDLNALIAEVLARADTLDKMGLAPDDALRGDAMERLAQGLSVTRQIKAALGVIGNLQCVAFVISVMAKGFVQVPDNVLEIVERGATTLHSTAKRVLEQYGPRAFRGALLMTLAVSPLVMLTSRDLLKDSLCEEHILLLGKNLGNQKPKMLREWEDWLWNEVFMLAEGKQTGEQAYRSIKVKLQRSAAVPYFDSDSARFFDSIEQCPYEPPPSVHRAVVLFPAPLAWPLPPAAGKLIEWRTAAPGSPEATPAPGASLGAAPAPSADDHEIVEGGLGSNPDPEPSQAPAALHPRTESTDGATSGHGIANTAEEAATALERELFGRDPLHPPGCGGIGGGSEDSDCFGATPDLTPSPCPSPAPPATTRPLPGAGTPLPPPPNFPPRRSGGQMIKKPKRKQRRSSAFSPAEEGSEQELPIDEHASSGGEDVEESPSGGEHSPGGEPDGEDIEEYSWDNIQQCDNNTLEKLEKQLLLKLEETKIIIPPTKSNTHDLIDLTTSLSPPCKIDKHSRFLLWDSRGTCTPVDLELYLREDQLKWTHILTEAVGQYALQPDKATWSPLFLSSPSESQVYATSYSSFCSLSTSEVQTLFGAQHILLSDSPGPLHDFNLEGMQCIADIFWQTEIQDQSIPILLNALTLRNRRGSLYDMYTCAAGPLDQQRPLNGLSFPQRHEGVYSSPFASDVRALHRTDSEAGCFAVFPPADIRFGLAATRRAYSYWHVDQRGEATYVRVIAGLKAWVIATPKDPGWGASTTFWNDLHLDVTNVDLSKFNLEVCLMRPGDMLLMQPNTLHAVLTIEDSLCHGGHFLATSCLARTVFGAVHSFFEGDIATNIDHPSIQGRMNSLVCFFYKTLALNQVVQGDLPHMPELNTPKGLKQLMIFACGIELQNAICRTSYEPTTDEILLSGMRANHGDAAYALQQFDLSAKDHELRLQNMYSRGRMLETLRAVFQRLAITDSAGQPQDPWGFLFTPALSWFLQALRQYYKLSCQVPKACRTEDASMVPPHLFERQLSWTEARWEGIGLPLPNTRHEELNPQSLEYPWPEFHVVCDPNPDAASRDALSYTALLNEGLRKGDMMYLAGYSKYRPRNERKRDPDSDDTGPAGFHRHQTKKVRV